MAWLHINSEKGFRADITDDDGNVVGILSNYRLNVTNYSLLEAQAEFTVIVTDMDKWFEAVHNSFHGGVM